MGSSPTTDTIIKLNNLEVIIMKTILAIKNRINVLQARDPVGNQNIINKLKRKLRKLEKNNSN